MNGHAGQTEKNMGSKFLSTDRMGISFRKLTHILYMNGHARQTEKKWGLNAHEYSEDGDFISKTNRYTYYERTSWTN